MLNTEHKRGLAVEPAKHMRIAETPREWTSVRARARVYEKRTSEQQDHERKTRAMK